MALSWDLVAQLAWTGLASASPYWLFAMAFALVLKVNRVWNFAQAGIMVVAYYAMFVAFRWLALPPAAGLLLALAVTCAASWASEWFGFRTLRRRRSGILTYFIFTITLAQLAVYSAELAFGTDPKTLFRSILSPVTIVGPVIASRWDATALATAALLTGGLWFLLRRTAEGKRLVAVADNPDLAELYGINTARAYATSMAAAGVLVTAGMYLIGTKAPVVPSAPMNQFLIPAVIATIIAGLGNVFAAGFAAVCLSLIQAFSIIVISSRWQVMINYGLILVVILLFPSGVRLPRWRLSPKPVLTPGAPRAGLREVRLTQAEQELP